MELCDCVWITDGWTPWPSRTNTPYWESITCLTSLEEQRYFRRSIWGQGISSWKSRKRIFQKPLSARGMVTLSLQCCHSDWLTPRQLSWHWWIRCSTLIWIPLWSCWSTISWYIPPTRTNTRNTSGSSLRLYKSIDYMKSSPSVTFGCMKYLSWDTISMIKGYQLILRKSKKSRSGSGQRQLRIFKVFWD